MPGTAQRARTSPAKIIRATADPPKTQFQTQLEGGHDAADRVQTDAVRSAAVRRVPWRGVDGDRADGPGAGRRLRHLLP